MRPRLILPGGGPGGGSGEPDPAVWTKITAWGAVNDPNGYLDAGSGHVGSGLVRLIPVGDTTQYNGLREGGAGVDVRIRDIPGLENWDPTTDVLQFLWRHGIPLDAGAVGGQYGAALCVTNFAIADYASSDGLGYLIRQRTTTDYLASAISDTGGTGATLNTPADVGYFTLVPQFNVSAPQQQRDMYAAQWREVIGAGPTYGWAPMQINSQAMHNDPDDRWIRLMLMHQALVSDTPTIESEVWWHRLRGPGVEDLTGLGL